MLYVFIVYKTEEYVLLRYNLRKYWFKLKYLIPAEELEKIVFLLRNRAEVARVT